MFDEKEWNKEFEIKLFHWKRQDYVDDPELRKMVLGLIYPHGLSLEELAIGRTKDKRIYFSLAIRKQARMMIVEGHPY